MSVLCAFDGKENLLHRSLLRWSLLRCGLLLMTCGLGTGGFSPIQAEEDWQRPPISYRTAEADNVITRLETQWNQAPKEVSHDLRFGYLQALLEALEIPVESQLLVYSKTSLQMNRISPRTPRAIYFNDDTYVGYCVEGDVLEISTTDSQLGTVFYTLKQRYSDRLTFNRETDRCLSCHHSARTENVPGHLVRSLWTNPQGLPWFAAGSFTVTHRTPLTERWGGWYVTGKHGEQTHMGNLLLDELPEPGRHVSQPVDNSTGVNLTDLSDRIAAEDFLSPHSDLIAHLIFAHQTFVHNRLTQAHFTTRQALHYQATMNEALGEPEGTRYDSTTRRINNAAEALVEALLLCGEPPLTAPLSGTSGFAELYQKQGKRDAQGRSLKDLDLQQRLFRYPCSPLIYSSAFVDLPPEMRDVIWQRLREILVEDHKAEKYSHLTSADRQAIVEILQETHPTLPKNWPAR